MRYLYRRHQVLHQAWWRLKRTLDCPGNTEADRKAIELAVHAIDYVMTQYVTHGKKNYRSVQS